MYDSSHCKIFNFPSSSDSKNLLLRTHYPILLVPFWCFRRNTNTFSLVKLVCAECKKCCGLIYSIQTQIVLRNFRYFIHKRHFNSKDVQIVAIISSDCKNIYLIHIFSSSKHCKTPPELEVQHIETCLQIKVCVISMRKRNGMLNSKTHKEPQS